MKLGHVDGGMRIRETIAGFDITTRFGLCAIFSEDIPRNCRFSYVSVKKSRNKSVKQNILQLIVFP